ncbi:helix-turn-helix transcriptional regulator [Streptomyces sp. SAJ15]|uniref:ArsR/SmtB family transcription factor n=1 Tax=Streptomyces sp. SAJ15 TaxID=2011095 RepID=UPI0011857232|nr:helix-turn-helix transcriptional regulator [Streptomyces sp. SAJ15]TVL88112.1 transcriptional regulator [Streptomyces sp. SAJ15]
MPDADGHPAPGEMELRAVLGALADPLRYEIVSALLAEPPETARHCSSFGLPISKSTRTHHFRVLREAGLIRQVDRGNSRMATLRRAELDARFPGLLDLVAQNLAEPPADPPADR